MEKIEGLYTAITTIIKEKEAEDRLAISTQQIVDELKRTVDVYSASLEWYINFALNAAVSIGLNNNGYRSVIRGNGLYVNLENCSNPKYLARLFENAKLTKMQKEQVLEQVKNRIIDVSASGQMSFDFETGSITEDISTDTIIEMLKRDAGIE